MKAWQQRDLAFSDLQLHVNLSGIDVAHPSLVGRVNSALAEAELRPQDLTLELTENTLMQRLEGALPGLITLRQSGIGLSIDDFGTGYSSLMHLSSLPVNGLKIAPGFVADINRGASEYAIVQAIVLMADSLGMSVVAEGIESSEQIARLRAAGCQSGQGFFLSRPLDAERVERLLDKELGALLAAERRAPESHRETVPSHFH